MPTPPTKRIIRLRFRRLKRHYRDMIVSFDEDAIHDFRVEFKKLRAFLRLLSTGKDQQKIKIPRRLKELYQKAGAVRDLQLHKKYIEKNRVRGTLIAYLRELRSKLTVAKRELRAAMDPGVLEKAKQKIEKKIPAGLPGNAGTGLADVKAADINRIAAKKLVRDEDLHTVRKAVKDIIYNAKIFTTELSIPFRWKEWNKKKGKDLTLLADRLGEFQDSCTLIQFFKENEQATIPAKEKQLIRKMHGEQWRKKRLTKQSIKGQLLLQR